MKKTVVLSIMLLFFACVTFAQPGDEKPAMLFENMYIMPKKGMSEKFEAAIKAHDTKFHPDGPYKAGLRRVEYGDKAGWYVWVFGPTSFSGLDTRPSTEGGHAADWTATIDPLVDVYGETTLWQYNEKLSYGMDKLKTDKYYEVWSVKLKQGQYYRFTAMAEKLKAAYESMGDQSFLVYNNVFHTANGADVGIIWSFNTYADWAKDSGTKEAFEKIYGPRSWMNMFDEWNDMIISYDSEIRSILK